MIEFQIDKSWTVSKAMAYAKRYLSSAGVTDARSAAQWFFEYALDCDYTALLNRRNALLTDQQRRFLDSAVTRSASGEPTQYILGEAYFAGKPFAVGEGVLIPRDDTHVLLEAAVKSAGASYLELCTGSGCIAVEIKCALPDAEVSACDISATALGYARQNAERHGAGVELILCDLFEGFTGRKFDTVVCNPPYISEAEYVRLEDTVKAFEPRLALHGGEDGLDFYRRVTLQAPEYLNDGGVLLLEIGFDQAKSVCGLLEKRFIDIKVLKDISGHDRVVAAKKG